MPCHDDLEIRVPGERSGDIRENRLGTRQQLVGIVAEIKAGQLDDFADLAAMNVDAGTCRRIGAVVQPVSQEVSVIIRLAPERIDSDATYRAGAPVSLVRDAVIVVVPR